jgi:aryl-alcohol dehydrogenase-like predicted oxidoreductase
VKYRTLGRTGLRISEIGFGAWAIGSHWGPQDENESLKALHTAIDLGVNFIDTAAGYGDGKSERIIAKVLKERKEDIIVATKTPPAPGPWPPSPYCKIEDRFSERYIRSNVEDRLRYLNTDCIDILQLHTWTRAWNSNPEPLLILQKLKEEGKLRFIGISTPEDDQNSVIDLMRNGLVDTVQVIFNIFEQQPVAELFPEAIKNDVGIIVRVVFDEGVLTGKYKADSKFPEGDFRRNYFAGDRLERAIRRVNKIKEEFSDTGLSMPQLAIKYTLSHKAVSTVIPGIRNIEQAEQNTAVSDLPPLSEDTLYNLRKHEWRRYFWYSGKN